MAPEVPIFASRLPAGSRLRRLIALLLLALLAGPSPAQDIPSALPAAGHLLDLRDVREVSAAEGELLLNVGQVWQSATRYFDASGERRDLSLDQAVTRQSTSLLLSYGLGHRWNAGAGLSVVNQLARRLSVLNFVPGASLLGQALPVGATTDLEQQGSGPGDLGFYLQYEPAWFGRRPHTWLTLDAVVPTARSASADPFELPLGQGYRTYRVSCSAMREIFPMTYFAKAGFEFNRSATLRDAAGRDYRLDPGEGLGFTTGASYAIGKSVGLQGLLVGQWRDQGRRSDQAVPVAHTRSLDFRPGLTFGCGAYLVTSQLSMPVSGRNVLSMNGAMLSAEVRF